MICRVFLIVFLVHYSAALECSMGGSGITCEKNKTKACYVTSKDDEVSVGCNEAADCSTLIHRFPIERGFTVFCCNNKDQCNSFEKPMNGNITCYDSADRNTTCVTSGFCYSIKSNDTDISYGCSALPCYLLNEYYTRQLGMDINCCSYDYCNKAGSITKKLTLITLAALAVRFTTR